MGGVITSKSGDPGVNKYVHQANKGLPCICSLHALTQLIHLGNAKQKRKASGLERRGETEKTRTERNGPKPLTLALLRRLDESVPLIKHT